MSVPTSDPSARESGYVEMARDLGRSRSGQILVATVIMAFFVWLGWWAWTRPTDAGQLFAFVIVGFGFTKVWPILPIPIATRERWKREEEIVAGTLAANLRFTALLGPLLAFKQWANNETMHLMEPLIYTTVGIFCFWLCRRRARAALKAPGEA